MACNQPRNWADEAEAVLRAARQQFNNDNLAAVSNLDNSTKNRIQANGILNITNKGQTVGARLLGSAWLVFEELVKNWDEFRVDVRSKGTAAAVMKLSKKVGLVVGANMSFDSFAHFIETQLFKSGVFSEVTNFSLKVHNAAEASFLSVFTRVIIFDLVPAIYNLVVHGKIPIRQELADWCWNLAKTTVVTFAAIFIGENLGATLLISFLIRAIIGLVEVKFPKVSRWSSVWSATKHFLGWRQSARGWNVPDNINVPAALICPISHCLFYEPAVLLDVVYERSFIEEWVERNGTDIYRNRVSLTMIRPCYQMQHLAHDFAEAHEIPEDVI